MGRLDQPRRGGRYAATVPVGTAHVHAAAEAVPASTWEPVAAPAEADEVARVTLGAPVRDAMTWSAARETAVEPRRSVQPDDVMTLVKRLASKKPAQPQKVGVLCRP